MATDTPSVASSPFWLPSAMDDPSQIHNPFMEFASSSTVQSWLSSQQPQSNISHVQDTSSFDAFTAEWYPDPLLQSHSSNSIKNTPSTYPKLDQGQNQNLPNYVFEEPHRNWDREDDFIQFKNKITFQHHGEDDYFQIENAYSINQLSNILGTLDRLEINSHNSMPMSSTGELRQHTLSPKENGAACRPQNIPTRHRTKPWTQEKKKEMISKRKSGKPWQKIARKLGRNKIAYMQARYREKAKVADRTQDIPDIPNIPVIPMLRFGQTWTQKEEEEMISKRENGVTWRKIALKLGRTTTACRQKRGRENKARLAGRNFIAMQHHKKRWTQEDIKQLLLMHKNGMSWEKIASNLGRSKQACQTKILLRPAPCTREAQENRVS